MSTSIRVFTDGACRGNPGPGGWGALIIDDKEEFSLWGGEKDTTNNQMEMTAAIKALEYFKESSNISLTTDSNYVKDGIEKWISGWKKNGWKTAAKKPVKGRELQHSHLGNELMTKIKEDMKEIGKVELHPKFDGKQMIMVIQPL